MRAVTCLLVLLRCALVPGAASADVRRVVSLNPCLDTILVSVADREQIAALSHYARDPRGSTISEIAQTFPITYESAEEVIAFNPDLVLTSRHSSLATRNALRRLAIQTELFDVPESVVDSIEQVRTVARLVSRVEKGEALIADIEAALAAAQPDPAAPKLTALIFQSNGFAAGNGTLVDEMLTRTGFENVASTYNLGQWGNVVLEHVVANPPQVLLAGEVLPGTPTWAERVLSHPVLKRIPQHMTRAVFPDRLLYCGGPVLIASSQALSKARRQSLERQP